MLPTNSYRDVKDLHEEVNRHADAVYMHVYESKTKVLSALIVLLGVPLSVMWTAHITPCERRQRYK